MIPYAVVDFVAPIQRPVNYSPMAARLKFVHFQHRNYNYLINERKRKKQLVRENKTNIIFYYLDYNYNYKCTSGVI